MNPLTPQEQFAIANLNEIQKRLFSDWLLDNKSGGPDYYDGWARDDFESVLFSGPDAFREALQFAITH